LAGILSWNLERAWSRPSRELSLNVRYHRTHRMMI
jgi:hypothetical protein